MYSTLFFFSPFLLGAVRFHRVCSGTRYAAGCSMSVGRSSLDQIVAISGSSAGVRMRRTDVSLQQRAGDLGEGGALEPLLRWLPQSPFPICSGRPTAQV